MQQKDLSDEAIARAVCVKVGDSPGVSYSHIAAKAYECGRTELAIKVTPPFCHPCNIHVSVAPHVTLLYSMCVYVTYVCMWFADVWTRL